MNMINVNTVTKLKIRYYTTHCTQENLYSITLAINGLLLPLALLLVPKQQGKSNATPVQAYSGSEGSRRLRLPDFETIGT
jgi:hypothetical protein